MKIDINIHTCIYKKDVNFLSLFIPLLNSFKIQMLKYLTKFLIAEHNYYSHKIVEQRQYCFVWASTFFPVIVLNSMSGNEKLSFLALYLEIN